MSKEHFALFKDQHGYYHDHNSLYPLLGLKEGQHLPDEGFDRQVGGVHVLVKSKDPEARHNTSKHRVFVMCSCDKYIPFGRIGQHLKGKVHQS